MSDFLSLADDLIICVRVLFVHEGVQQGKDEKAYDRRPDKKARVIEAEHVQYLADEREGEAQVHARQHQRQGDAGLGQRQDREKKSHADDADVP